MCVLVAGCCSKDKAAATTPAPAAQEAEPSGQPPAPEPPEPPRTPPEAEPAEPPHVAATTPCDEYFAVIAEMETHCVDKIPASAMDAMRQGRDAMRAAFADWDKLDAESRQAATDAAAQGCLQARDAIVQVRASMGC